MDTDPRLAQAPREKTQEEKDVEDGIAVLRALGFRKESVRGILLMQLLVEALQAELWSVRPRGSKKK